MKLLYINDNSANNDLIAIANILRTDYNAPNDELIKRSCDNLLDLNSLQQLKKEQSAEEEDEERLEKFPPIQPDDQDFQTNCSLRASPTQADAHSISSITKQVA